MGIGLVEEVSQLGHQPSEFGIEARTARLGFGDGTAELGSRIEVGRLAADAGRQLLALAVPGYVEQHPAAALGVGAGSELTEGVLHTGRFGPAR